MKKNGYGYIDWFTLLPAIFLLWLSVVFVYSSSSAAGEGGNAIRHLLWVITSTIILFAIPRIDYHNYCKYLPGKFPIILSVLILLLTLIIGDTDKENTATRWISIFGFQFQPLEFVKIAVILYLSGSIANNQDKMGDLKYVLQNYLLPIGIILFLLTRQPNYSGTIIVCSIAMFLLLMGGEKLKHWFAICGVIIVIGVSLIALESGAGHVRDRMMTFTGLADTELSQKVGYQTTQSMIALGSGGVTGLGAGQTKQAFSYLPLAYSDFIYAIIGEEFGFVLTSLVLLAFVAIVIRGFMIARIAPDLYGSLLAYGVVFSISIAAIIHIATNLGLIVTGIPLPFVSLGGTALICYSISIGILLNVSAQANIIPRKIKETKYN